MRRKLASNIKSLAQMNKSCTGGENDKRNEAHGQKLARATRPPTERFATMKSKIVFAALALGLLSSTVLAAEPQWTDEETASGMKKMEFVRFAFAGTKMNLQYLYAVDLDCSTVEGWSFEITKQPEHGTAEIVSQSFFPMFPKDNPRYRCNEHKIEGQLLTYKANAGYKGPDSLTYLQIGPSGLAWEKTYHFNVRSLPATSTSRPKQRGALSLPEIVVPKSHLKS